MHTSSPHPPIQTLFLPRAFHGKLALRNCLRNRYFKEQIRCDPLPDYMVMMDFWLKKHKFLLSTFTRAFVLNKNGLLLRVEDTADVQQ